MRNYAVNVVKEEISRFVKAHVIHAMDGDCAEILNFNHPGFTRLGAHISRYGAKIEADREGYKPSICCPTCCAEETAHITQV